MEIVYGTNYQFPELLALPSCPSREVFKLASFPYPCPSNHPLCSQKRVSLLTFSRYQYAILCFSMREKVHKTKTCTKYSWWHFSIISFLYDYSTYLVISRYIINSSQQLHIYHMTSIWPELVDSLAFSWISSWIYYYLLANRCKSHGCLTLPYFEK